MVLVAASVGKEAGAQNAGNVASEDTVRAWSLLGDLRTGYFAQQTEARDGTTSDKDEGQLRIRFGAEGKLSERWSGRFRAAGRYSTGGNPGEVKFFKAIPTTEGLRFGDTTIDELFFHYARDPARRNQPEQFPNREIKLGRFQSKFVLDGVARKSLDRHTSPETQITWTDGVWFTFVSRGGWRNHVLAQYNSSEGATEVRREPLDFSSNRTRVSYFFATENRQRSGPVVQRGVDLSILPEALCTDGVSSCTNRDTYWALVFRGALNWPLGQGGMNFGIGGAAGFAPNTQLRTVARTGASGNADGSAVQVSFNLVDFFPSHSIGFVFGRVGAGWLISPDFRNNNTLIEGRYRWQIARQHTLEFRLRRREDLKTLIGETNKQVDDDVFLRYTYKHR